MNTLIVGPSGAGKTHLLQSLREDASTKDTFYTLDLDVVGFRTKGESWTKWHIPSFVIDMVEKLALVSRRPAVVAGACSESDDLIGYAKEKGFRVLALIPKHDVLVDRRRNRGDSDEKIAEASSACASWISRSLHHGVEIYEEEQEIILAVIKRAKTVDLAAGFTL